MTSLAPNRNHNVASLGRYVASDGYLRGSELLTHLLMPSAGWCRRLNVRSLGTSIDWRHCLVQMGLEIGCSEDQDGC